MERRHELTRRDVLRLGALGAAGTTLGVLHQAARLPIRLAVDAVPSLPDIQHDITPFLAPVETIDGVAFRFGPVFTKFVTAGLTRVPTSADQRVLGNALSTIEDTYHFAPDGVFTFVSYGLPYFRLLPRGLAAAHVPRLVDAPTRFALEEAIPSPTDVTYGYGRVVKERFNVPVRIEENALLFTIRSDNLESAGDVEAWLAGSDVLAGQEYVTAVRVIRFDPARVMFTQRGCPPRRRPGGPFANRIHRSHPWMGFADQHVSGSGSAAITTFGALRSRRLGSLRRLLRQHSVQHLSRDFGPRAVLRGRVERAATPRSEREAARRFGTDDYRDGPTATTAAKRRDVPRRVQYVFRSRRRPRPVRRRFTDGGGPTFLPTSSRDRRRSYARSIGTPEANAVGHLSTPASSRFRQERDPHPHGRAGIRRSTYRTARTSRLHFSIFVPTAGSCMRTCQASVALLRSGRRRSESNGS
jgi:hypothetical protein